MNTIEQNGRYLDLHPDGQIGYPGCLPSGDWKCTGAVGLNNFGRIVKRYTLKDIQNGRVPWKWKNGKQRCHLTDLDHGTPRMWGSPDHKVY